jgi:hypothetical protein
MSLVFPLHPGPWGPLAGKGPRAIQLTDIAIRNAKAREKPCKVSDILGFFLLVPPSGGKLWSIKSRIDDETIAALGIYPQVGLAEARRRLLILGCLRPKRGHSPLPG